jgi:hypothetical protein
MHTILAVFVERATRLYNTDREAHLITPKAL